MQTCDGWIELRKQEKEGWEDLRKQINYWGKELEEDNKKFWNDIDKQMNEIDKEEKEDREIKRELVEINKRINKIIEACN